MSIILFLIQMLLVRYTTHYIPYYTFKRSGKICYLVLRWKKCIIEIPTLVKGVNVGPAEDLAEILEN